MSLRKFSVRSLQLRPGRTILTLLSIVIGVAAIVAVALLTATTRGAYRKMFATVTGNATLEVDAAGGAGFDGAILEKVAGVPGVKVAAPLVKRPTTLLQGEKQVRVQVLGIDPARDGGVREYDIVAGRQLGKGDELLMDEQLAGHLGLKVADKVELRTKRLKKPFELVGVIRPRGGEALRLASLAYMPLPRAQYYFNPRGRLELIDAIQIVTPDNVDKETVRAQIAKLLPQGVDVHEPAGSTQLMRETLLSSEKGLRLASLFTVLLASFIILNTLLMNVGERRRHLAIMRAIGATRGQLALAIISESLLLGVVGSGLGMLAGLGAAWLLNRTMSSALEVTLPPVRDVITWAPLARGLAFGVGMAILGAIIPAYRAGRVSPLEGLSRVAAGDLTSNAWRFLAAGLILTIAGGAVIYAGVIGLLPVDAPIYGGISFLVGFVFLETAILRPQATLIAWLIGLAMRVEAALALKQILRHNTRSALTVGVLFIAGAAGIGMANSILDNVYNVHDWYRQAVVGDYFLRAMMPDMASGTAPDLPDGIGEELAKLKNIESLDGIAYLEATIPGKSEDESLTAIAIARSFNHPDGPAFDLIEGDRTRLRDELHAGQVVVGSVLAQRLNLHAGGEIPLKTLAGVERLKIAGIANDYMVGGMSIHMHRKLAEKALGVEGYDGYIVRADKRHLAALEPVLSAIAKKYDVVLQSNAQISATVNRMVRGVEGGLWALVYLGFVVAGFGVVNTLTMNVLEQTRELGLLRIVAMTKKQVRRTIVTQALIIGGVGLPPGIVVGVATAYIMNQSMQSVFGHPVVFHIHPELLTSTLVGALLIVLIAAFIPARRAARIDVVEALHYE